MPYPGKNNDDHPSTDDAMIDTAIPLAWPDETTLAQHAEPWTSPPQASLPPSVSSASGPAQASTPSSASMENNGERFFVEGESFLRGGGAAADESRAIACFLNASDCGHAGGAFKAALMYFTGVGITRNLEESYNLAKRCLELGAPSSMAEKACNEILEESLGTENALRLLKVKEEVLIQSTRKQVEKKKRLALIASVVAALLLIAGLGAFWFTQEQVVLDAPPVGSIGAVITPEERAQAKKEALIAVAKLKANASASGTESNVAPRKNDF